MSLSCKQKNIGFTLAEILITLTIIGIVASLTIPSLVNNVTDQQYRTAWKKAYSDIALATMRMAADNGGNLKSICPDLDDNCLANKYKDYFNYTKQCLRNQTNGNCWSASDKSLTGVDSSIDSGCSGFILNNGSFVIMRNEQFSTCLLYGYRCGYAWVDVNGFKEPNTLGKDIYGVFITETSASPWGASPDSFGCQGSTGGYAGAGCSAQYLYQ